MSVVRVKRGFLLRLNNFFFREIVRFNVHSLTGVAIRRKIHRLISKWRCEMAVFSEKVSESEHLFYVVIIYLFFYWAVVNVARPRCSLSEG